MKIIRAIKPPRQPFEGSTTVNTFKTGVMDNAKLGIVSTMIEVETRLGDRQERSFGAGRVRE